MTSEQILSPAPTADWNRNHSVDPEDSRGRVERILQSTRIKGPEAWVELLQNREDWNLAPEAAQDEAIKVIARQLGEAYSYVKTEFYECGGQKHRIAQFEHQKSQYRLNLLPGGRFEMGSQNSEKEQPLHPVRVPPLLMGTTLLSGLQWGRLHSYPNLRGALFQQSPCRVSWHSIQYLLERTQDSQLSLPSEAEWEYACRAGTQSQFYFGDDEAELADYAWYRKNSKQRPFELGRLKPNAFGLYDCHGLLWEFCQDSWQGNYQGAPQDGSPWIPGELDLDCVVRGGCWHFDSKHCRSASRNRRKRNAQLSDVGFRLCRGLNQKLGDSKPATTEAREHRAP